MTSLPSAKPSPRIWHGVLWWDAGDTFTLTLQLELTDQDGDSVHVGTADGVQVLFYDETQALVYTFSVTGVTDDRVQLAFDEALSAKFPKGSYSYDIVLTHGDRTTLARGNRAVVE